LLFIVTVNPHAFMLRAGPTFPATYFNFMMF